ncbi:roadblock/LC7 domain-containing protein [Natronosporangium hydrolyticum]|uniref:Roadblock/LC7 domain-containing protein n=1 Tax=Natronosporangium hydrolyticum TaxID=2811111 RepID=A0A895Y9K5_9ACTN|nr:roadblock/LC7 domain-containing protein [Natronosporangium hydrolyticum]QSB14011.1 roadblock/LC7 domain-containing protein [Natronosporangium hydrolyticum]
MPGHHDAASAANGPHTELAALRQAVNGVVGSVITGVDGLLLLHDLADGTEPHDLAALAAATFGLGRQTALALRHGPFRESTVRSHRGYFAVYAINDRALLAVLGDSTLNVARLHLEAREAAGRLASMLDAHIASQPRL